jgi:predicted ATP-binding protein involved in virulence
MFVKQLQIRAFRGIESLDLRFHPGVNVLIGVNGVGKSSVIQCLTILLSSYIEKLKTLSKYGEDNSHLDRSADGHTIYNLKVNGDMNGTLNFIAGSSDSISVNGKPRLEVDSEDIKNGMNEAFIEVEIQSDLNSFRWSKSIIDRGRVNPRIHTDERQLDEFAQSIIHELSDKSNLGIPLVLCYPVNRAVFDISLELSDRIVFSQMEAFKDALTGTQGNFNAFFRWFRTLEDLENEERRDNSKYRDHRLEAIRKVLPAFLPEFTSLRVRRSPLRMTVFKRGEELIVNQLSDGEKCLLAMAGDLARRLAIANPGLSDPLQGTGIILIDEIELHLHPRWQRNLLPTLSSTFPNCQFIVSTHSPQIVSDVQADAIYVLQQTPQGLVAHHPMGSYGRDSNQILELIMAVSERPQWSDDGLKKVFRLIEEGDLAAANELKTELEQKMGADEPDVMKAGAMIRRREILGK